MKHCDIYTDFIILTIHVFRDSQLNVHSSFIKSYMVLGCYQMTRGKTCEEFMKIIKLLRIMNMCSSQSTVLFHQKHLLLFLCSTFGSADERPATLTTVLTPASHPKINQYLVGTWQVKFYYLCYCLQTMQSLVLLNFLRNFPYSKYTHNSLLNQISIGGK